MKNRKDYNKSSITFLLGIPIILVSALAYLFVSNYKPKYENVPLGTIIYSSDRYSESRKKGWHKIDLSSFSIEVPNDFHFYLEEGIHGGKSGGLTDSKDTINFVYGSYYFDACEGIVIGEIIGTCDTIKILNRSSRDLIIAQTDSYISAYSKHPVNDYVFKMWANLNIDRSSLYEMITTIEFND